MKVKFQTTGVDAWEIRDFIEDTVAHLCGVVENEVEVGGSTEWTIWADYIYTIPQEVESAISEIAAKVRNFGGETDIIYTTW